MLAYDRYVLYDNIMYVRSRLFVRDAGDRVISYVAYSYDIGKALSTWYLLQEARKPIDRFRILDNRLRVVMEERSGWLERCAVTFRCRYLSDVEFFFFTFSLFSLFSKERYGIVHEDFDSTFFY